MSGPAERPCADCGRPFTAGRYARYGPCCRWRHRGKPAKYVWTPQHEQILRDRYDGRVPGRAAAIARAWGWPGWVVKKRAAALGLCQPADRRPWTPEEIAFLDEHLGRRTTLWIARRLKRTLASVAMRAKHAGLSQRVGEGYTLRSLSECFGVSHHQILRWTRAGQLRQRGRRYENGSPFDAWRVTDADVLAFIRAHPTAFRLDKVDPLWFLELVLGVQIDARATA